MFLRKYGSSGKYTFDIIYSALQKSLRRNDINLAMQMAYEFKEYPNALKKTFNTKLYRGLSKYEINFRNI